MKRVRIARWRAAFGLCLGLVFFGPTPIFAQQQVPSALTLQQAVTIALQKNPAHRAAMDDTKAASAEIGEARSYLLPHVTFAETATRGDDPVYVFGTKLRQRNFTAADFGLNVLNTPAPIGNFATRFSGTWTLFDSFSSWHAIHRAESVKDAAGRQLDRTDQEIVFRVVNSYYGILLAKKQLEIAQQAIMTAQSILGRSKDRVDAGLVAQSDYLNAQVRAAERQQELIRAQNGLALARAELSAAMGTSLANDFDATDVLAEKQFPAVTLEDAEKQAAENRPDLKRIRAEEEAQKQSVSIAKSSFGPRINAFGGWEGDSATFVNNEAANNWVAGVEFQFDLFEGGAKRAELAHEEALREKSASTEQATEDEIRLEVQRAYYDADSARQEVDAARSAIAESQESLRVSQDRYGSGLLTITDLLGTEEAARRSQTDYWQAIYRYHMAYAAVEFASGTLSPKSPIVLP